MKKLISSAVILGMFSFAISTPVFAAGINVGNDAIDRAVVDTYSNFTIIDTNNPVSVDGWLTAFNYYAKNTNKFQFVLIDGSNVVKWVSPTVTPLSTGTQTYNAVVAVESGWNLGVHFDSTGTIPFDYVGAPATYTPNNDGPVIVGEELYVEGTSDRIYSWKASGTEAETCSTTTLLSSTDTQFEGLTTIDPSGSSNNSLFNLGVSGSAVLTDSDGYPGAWDAAEADPDVAGAIWVNNTATAPTPGGIGDGQDGSINVWRLFSHAFSIPAGATVSSAMLHFTSDNSVGAFLDEASVGTANDYTIVNDTALTVGSGTHELEFVVKNDAYNAINPTGLIYRAVIDYCVPNPAPECPAAPSVAGKLLKEHNVKAKAVTNYISQVAHEMGPQNTFHNVEACNITAYKDAVNVYLDTTLGAY